MNALRSLDWRLLLPLPPSGRFERLALIGADEATIEPRSPPGSPRTSSRARPGARANAVVCLQRAGFRSRLQWRRSPPAESSTSRSSADGVCAPRQTPPSREARGAWPACSSDATGRTRDLDEPEVYFPLDVPAAVEWYFQNVFVITTRRARLLATPTHLAARPFGRRLASAVPGRAWFSRERLPWRLLACSRRPASRSPCAPPMSGHSC